MVFVAIIRNIIFIIEEKRNCKNDKNGTKDYIILAVLYLISIVFAILTYNGILSMMSVVATMLYTFSVWQKNINWKMCKEIISLTTKPVFIAGGLNPENVRGAIEETMPYGVDVSTGISCYSESYLRKDRKDHKKIEKFISIAKEY